MPGRLAEVGAVAALATVVTLLLAAPVLRAPSERIFGAEIVGRHHDPFTAMQQFGRPIHLGSHPQALTDVSGALIARATGVRAAYNWLVLISFPLAAAAAYLLGRHLDLSPIGATVAATAYAFSPFHLAHAAYHPHIAQVQWVPLYLFALWRCLDRATPGAVAALVAATSAVTLSNFYGGFIAAVITPFALAAYWVNTRQAGAQPARRLAITVASLLAMAAAALAYAWLALGAMRVDGTDVMVSREDLFRYSAKWWSYLVPPVANPLLGPAAARFWSAHGVRDGLLEQQVSLGLGIVALGLIAIAGWWRSDRPAAPLARVPVLVVVAIAALVLSLSPERTIGTFHFVRPSSLLFEIAPMFRSYARFGVIVQLMAALLAAIGIDLLLRSPTRGARAVCVALVALAAAEYAVAPSALWRDMLPTAAHRWVMQQANAGRVLDCVSSNQESAVVQWLTDSRVLALSEAISDCSEPNLGQKLAALDYTHLLVRRYAATGQFPFGLRSTAGLRAVASFDGGLVFAVVDDRPAIYTSAMSGFSPREQDEGWSWRWMGAEGAWIIANTTSRPVAATLDVELSSFLYPRRITVSLNGQHVQSLDVEPARRMYRIGPFMVPPAAHQLQFQPSHPPTVADDAIHNRDRRPLSVAIGAWTWNVAGAP